MAVGPVARRVRVTGFVGIYRRSIDRHFMRESWHSRIPHRENARLSLLTSPLISGIC